MLCCVSAFVGFFGCFAWFDVKEVFTIPGTDKTFQRVPQTTTWKSEPTDGTVFSFTQSSKTEVVLYYENGAWHVLKEDAK